MPSFSAIPGMRSILAFCAISMSDAMLRIPPCALRTSARWCTRRLRRSTLGKHDPAPVHDRAGGTATELPAVERGVPRLAPERGRPDPQLFVGVEQGDVRGAAGPQRPAGQAQDAGRAGGEQLDQALQADDAG